MLVLGWAEGREQLAEGLPWGRWPELMAVVCAEQNLAHRFPSGKLLPVTGKGGGLHLQLPHSEGKVLAWEHRSDCWLCSKVPACRVG